MELVVKQDLNVKKEKVLNLCAVQITKMMVMVVIVMVVVTTMPVVTVTVAPFIELFLCALYWMSHS